MDDDVVSGSSRGDRVDVSLTDAARDAHRQVTAPSGAFFIFLSWRFSVCLVFFSSPSSSLQTPFLFSFLFPRALHPSSNVIDTCVCVCVSFFYGRKVDFNVIRSAFICQQFLFCFLWSYFFGAKMRPVFVAMERHGTHLVATALRSRPRSIYQSDVGTLVFFSLFFSFLVCRLSSPVSVALFVFVLRNVSSVLLHFIFR